MNFDAYSAAGTRHLSTIIFLNASLAIRVISVFAGCFSQNIQVYQFVHWYEQACVVSHFIQSWFDSFGLHKWKVALTIEGWGLQVLPGSE